MTSLFRRGRHPLVDPARAGRRFVARGMGMLVAPLLSSAAIADVPETAIPSSASTSEMEIAGLEKPAEILIDRWGVPHIYAASVQDAFFLQGYNAARDRLWQIDLWRKRGLGLLARDFGPRYVEQDRASRLFLYRGDMASEWQAYGPNAASYALSFTAGINAYVKAVRSGAQPLPPEFRIAGTAPDLWSPEDVVRIRSHGIIGNVENEVQRARTVCASGLAADVYRSKLEPAWTTSVPAGLDPCSVPSDVLKDYTLGTRGVNFDGPAESAGRLDADHDLAAESHQDVNSVGSNNWVISGKRTATGRPILASDPHRAYDVPSLRYMVHLNAPGLSVIGAGEPALPGISIGHNDTIGFGLTIFSIDQEDLYGYELDAAGKRYRYAGRFEPIRDVTETIEVRGEAPRTVTLRFTRHGPILKMDSRAGRAWALRSVWLEPGTAAYFGSSTYMTARTSSEFVAAMDRWGAPGENQVFADTSGNIGWVPAGMTPRRRSYDGLMPVPGDGRYEWEGFLPRAELPMALNPAQGWLATANQMNLPPAFPIGKRRVAFEWADPSRYQRIAEVLAADDDVTLADAMALQNDSTSPIQRRFVELVRTVQPDDGASALENAALALVQGWNGRVERGSSAATVAEIWLNDYLPNATTVALFPHAASVIGRPSMRSVLEALEKPDHRLGADPVARRDQILRKSLGEAVARIVAALGENPADWHYGRLHKAHFVHPLTPLAAAPDRLQLDIGPLSVEGSWGSPLAASFNEKSELTVGASFRMVLDIGNWDASQAINTPGQSGDPLSPHYRDLAPLWAHGRYFPLVYSRAAVLAATTRRLVLRPASSGVPGK